MSRRKIPEQWIERIRQRADLVAVVSEHLVLKKSGRNFVGLCPFHTEKTPSFVVSPEKQLFHCFGCGAGGDIFHFLANIEQISFLEAARQLAKRVGVSLPSERETEAPGIDQEMEQMYQLNEKAAALFHQNLMERGEAEAARRYLQDRGLLCETWTAFSIGFALPSEDLPGRLKAPPALLEKVGLIRKGENGDYNSFRNRILFPIQTLAGRTVGFGGRALTDVSPKYLNTGQTPLFTKGTHLFGLHLARGKKSLILVEGYFDLLSLYQAGIRNAAATLGTALTEEHLYLIRRFAEKLFLVLDPDPAGEAAALRAAPLLLTKKIPAEIVSLPVGEDPDLFIRKRGREAFLERLGRGESVLQFAIRQAAQAFHGAAPSLEQKITAIRKLFALISKTASAMERGDAFKQIAATFEMDERDVRADFAKTEREENRGAPSPLLSPSTHRLPEDEATLLALLIQERLQPEQMHSLVPDDFTTPPLHHLACHFWDEQTQSWRQPGSLVHHLDETERPLFTALAVRDIPHENEQKLRDDCARSLCAKRLWRETLKVQRELKSAEQQGDRVLATSLQHTFFNLKKALSQLSPPTRAFVREGNDAKRRTVQ